MKNLQRFRAIYGFIDFFILSFLIFDYGFVLKQDFRPVKMYMMLFLTALLLGFNIFKYFLFRGKKEFRLTILVNMLLLIGIVVSSIAVIIANPKLPFSEIFKIIKPILHAGLFFYFIIRLMVFVRHLYRLYTNPTILFVGSFIAIALVGSFLLMLPNATVSGISFVDALFTATSAVCVTGLIVLDTAHDFTLIGQTIILILIQLGGIGILTFTSFFSYFFKGSTSFREELYVKDFTLSDKLQDALKTAMQIVSFTLSLEFVGALYIYFTVQEIPESDRFFFSIFHSVSAFCNAGFSTLPSGLFDTITRFNYAFQWGIMILVVLGGLGYSIVFNFFTYWREFLINIFIKHTFNKPIRVITLNTKIVFYTTLILLSVSTVFFLLAENSFTQAEHTSVFGKFTTAVFDAVTPRTAGFNTVDFSKMAMPSLLIVLLLMWIGASPGSTGGGIKTTTFTIASLNIFSIAQGRNHIELGTREVSSGTVNRAFAIIAVSLISIGTCILLLLFLEPDARLIDVIFESFSAYSTVGLSLGLTPTLGEPSKYVLIVTMLFGRIGTLNLLFGLMRRLQTKFYKYPQENIFIN
ncbi:MAG: potassium transporter [Flavobacteriales bacterium CG_4_9_14_3_um_filter_40_17]|nr:MAG: potassium transporter [Flavobacteriales bacterium CG_4_9_14_3_um_filter_40_17]